MIIDKSMVTTGFDTCLFISYIGNIEVTVYSSFCSNESMLDFDAFVVKKRLKGKGARGWDSVHYRQYNDWVFKKLIQLNYCSTNHPMPLFGVFKRI